MVFKHIVSLDERHESNSVEGSNKHERITKDWIEPYEKRLVLFVIIYEVISERVFDLLMRVFVGIMDPTWECVTGYNTYAAEHLIGFLVKQTT